MGKGTVSSSTGTQRDDGRRETVMSGRLTSVTTVGIHYITREGAGGRCGCEGHHAFQAVLCSRRDFVRSDGACTWKVKSGSMKKITMCWS